MIKKKLWQHEDEKPLTKWDLAKKMIGRRGLNDYTKAYDYITNLVEVIEEELKAGREVSLSGLGRFNLHRVDGEARTARIRCMKKECRDLPDRYRIRFRPFHKLEEDVSNALMANNSEDDIQVDLEGCIQ
jgi:nucleoid DNA-binding protein